MTVLHNSWKKHSTYSNFLFAISVSQTYKTTYFKNWLESIPVAILQVGDIFMSQRHTPIDSTSIYKSFSANWKSRRKYLWHFYGCCGGCKIVSDPVIYFTCFLGISWSLSCLSRKSKTSKNILIRPVAYILFFWKSWCTDSNWYRTTAGVCIGLLLYDLL